MNASPVDGTIIALVSLDLFVVSTATRWLRELPPVYRLRSLGAYYLIGLPILTVADALVCSLSTLTWRNLTLLLTFVIPWAFLSVTRKAAQEYLKSDKSLDIEDIGERRPHYGQVFSRMFAWVSAGAAARTSTAILEFTVVQMVVAVGHTLVILQLLLS